MSPIRILVVDDSRLFIDGFSRIIEAERDIEVVGRAVDGSAALAAVEALRPDLVVMDVNMPVMNGLEAVEQIMATRPTPILLQTADPSRRDDRTSFEALSRGALDLVAKPSLVDSPGSHAALREQVRLLASVPVVFRRRRRPRPSQPAGLQHIPSGSGGVAIVASTGGPATLADILAAIPPDFPLPIVVVQHLASGFAANLVAWLGGVSRLAVQQAADGMRLDPGVVHVAPDDAHVSISGGLVRLDRVTGPIEGHRPSGSRLLSSAARSWGRRAVGVVLTGMGSDGSRGLLEIRNAGGKTIAQDRESSIVYGMPRAALECGAAEQILAIADIAPALVVAARELGQPGVQ